MFKRYITKIRITVLMILVLAILAGCDQNDAIIGSWSLDKKKALEMQVTVNEVDLSRKLNGSEITILKNMVDKSYCNYEFKKDGSVSIEYFMTASSYGKEIGQWKKEDDTIIVKSHNTTNGRSGTRQWQMKDRHLVWQQPNGLPYYLIKINK